MGFFSKNRNENIKPLMDYIYERDAEDLFRYVVKIIRPSIFLGEICVYTDCEVSSVWFKDDKYGNIPKCYKKERISVRTLLEISYQKGKTAAAFLLGVFWEHGIGGEKNMAVALDWYSKVIDMYRDDDMQKEKSKCFTMAITKLRNLSVDLSCITADEGVAHAMTLTALRFLNGIQYEVAHEELKEQDVWINELVELGFFILCHYAKNKEAASMGELGVCMAQNHLECNKCINYTFELEYSDKIAKVGAKLIENCVSLARSGNPHARFYIENFLNIEF